MSISVERLRRWMLAGVVLLATVIVAILGYKSYLQHRLFDRLERNLNKLGIDIDEETNDYTISQSGGPGGKPLWTIHAAKAIHYKNGMVTLKNAGITLYGRKQDREDHISGGEFEYDTKTGTIQAAGEVHIDLQAPSGGKSEPTGKTDPHDDRIIHIRTTGLVFKKDLGIAATREPLDFQIKGITGSAVGAEYSSDSGQLVLESQVHASGLANDRPVNLTAAHAEFNRISQRATLQHATYEGTRPGAPSPEKANADDVILLLRADGTPQHIDASGNVTLQPTIGQVVHSAKMAVDLNPQGQLQTAHAFGGLRYAEDLPLRTAEGSAEDTRVWFDQHGLAQRMVSSGQVKLNQRTRPSPAAQWTTRNLSGNQIEAKFVPVGDGKQSAISEAHATGGAKVILQSVTQPSSQPATARAAAPVSSTTTLSAEGIDTTLLNTADGLGHLHGEGKAVLQQVSSNGAQQENHGDVMDITFHPTEKNPSTAHTAEPLNGIMSASLQGHITIAETPARKPSDTKPPVPGRGSANRADYDAAQDRLTLSGNAQWSTAGETIWATMIATDRVTGDAEAQGSIKASIVKEGAPATADVTHIVNADHAHLRQTTQTAEFFGSPTVPVRMFQGGSQVEAPALILEQAQQRLTAHSNGAGAQVHAVFSNTKQAKPGKRTPSVTRVSAHEMIYSDLTRQGIFSGEVQMDTGDGVVTAQQGTVFLQTVPAKASTGQPGAAPQAATKPATAAADGGLFNGEVERVVASGRVRLTQPGRHGAGEQLVYTAGDQKFVLTGTPSNPPSISDSRGTTQGTSLIFHAGDDSVEISGGPAGTSQEDVHTETRVKPRKRQQ